MKRNVIWGVIVGVLLLTLACRGGSSGTAEPTAAPAQAAPGSFELKIANQSPYDICYVQISTSDQSDWGADWLGAQEKIAAGASKSFSVPAGTHDVKVMTCDQVVLGTFWNISSDTTVEVGGRGLIPLLVFNESTTEICFVYIASSDTDTWGEDWLGQLESIPAQQGKRAFFVRPGKYDLLAQDCDGNDLVTEFEVQLSKETTWTISD